MVFQGGQKLKFYPKACFLAFVALDNQMILVVQLDLLSFMLVEPPVAQLVPICHQGCSTKTTGGP